VQLGSALQLPMEIGKPKRIYRVEPLRDPVPPAREPAEPEPGSKPEEPAVVPER